MKVAEEAGLQQRQALSRYGRSQLRAARDIIWKRVCAKIKLPEADAVDNVPDTDELAPQASDIGVKLEPAAAQPRVQKP